MQEDEKLTALDVHVVLSKVYVMWILDVLISCVCNVCCCSGATVGCIDVGANGGRFEWHACR
jgi:hypothetical protein